jgi:microcin C transport system ATP-binding protein
MTTPLLMVEGLKVSFGGKAVVHSLDFSIAPGEKLALVGESGSGKTVTALSLLRLAQNAAVGGKAVFTGVDAAERTASGAPGRPWICCPCPRHPCAGFAAATSP